MGYFHCQEAQQVGPMWSQSSKSLQQYQTVVLSSCYRAVSWTLPMAHRGTGHTPATDSTATFPLSLFLIQTPITNPLPRHYLDNHTVLQPVKNTKCTLKSLWQCLFPLEKEILLILGILHSPSLSNSFMAWTHITEQLMFHKNKSLETSASQKNSRTVNKQEKFWKTTNSLREQWGDCDAACAPGETANEVFAAVRGKRNHRVQHYHTVCFRPIHYKRFIFRNAKSHCSLIWWVTCPTFILKLKEKERFHERCHYT